MNKLLFLMLFLCCISCKKKDSCPDIAGPYCKTSNPLVDKSFLAEQIVDTSYVRIEELTYNCKQGYRVTNTYTQASFYCDCNGNRLYNEGDPYPPTYPTDFDSKTSYKKQIYPR
jgi:hypothetical protein